MKTMTFNSVLKTVLIMAVFSSFTLASAEDFWDDDIQYTITSDSTVKIIGNNIFENRYEYFDYDYEDGYLCYININIDIPGFINYQENVYAVTEIGDGAFYYGDYYYNDEEASATIKIYITIPKTVYFIGFHAFGIDNSDEILSINCQPETPPAMNNSFIGNTFLYVSTEAYPLYVEENNNNHFCSYVFDINGEKSNTPRYVEQYLNQPIIGVCYGFTAKIYPSENSTLFRRIKTKSGWEGVETGSWDSRSYSSNDSIFYSFECDQTTCHGEGMAVDFFVIEEGKNPSDIVRVGALGGGHGEKYYDYGAFSPKWEQSFQFMDSGISFSDCELLNGTGWGLAVTFTEFYNPCSGEKDSTREKTSFNNTDFRPTSTNNRSSGEHIYYSGDIVIPSTATYHSYYDDNDYTSSVDAIGWDAFKNCVDLTSISIPNTVMEIYDDAFLGCTGLTKVNITDLKSWCNTIFCSQFANPLNYAHHLYLNDSEVTDLEIPNTVEEIYWNSFSGCSGLSSVNIPNSVQKIGTKAFLNCSGMKLLIIGKSVVFIGTDAFYGCSGITSIKCFAKTPANVQDDSWYEKGNIRNHIHEKSSDDAKYGYFQGDTCFENCVYQNATLYVPMDAVEAYRQAEGWKYFQQIVGFYAYDCEVDGIYYSITSDGEVMVVHGDDAYQGVVNIPQTVTYEGVIYNVTGICSGAFADASLESLILPVTIGTVEEEAFTGCHIHSLVITRDGTWTAGAISCTVDNLYVMGTVTGIQGLQVNPNTVYSYPTVPPTCDEQSFTGYDGELHVPASALAAYFTAPYWCNFINIVGDAIEPTGLTVNRDSVEVLVGNQLRLTATAIPANATPNEIFWTSSDESIATVTNGIITAVKTGECDITAYLLDKSATCHVTVTEIAPTEVILDQEFAKLEIGSQLTLSATVMPEDATDKYVTWTTTNSDVATVDSLGVVTAVGQGECFITASCRDNQAMCHIIVVDHFVFITLDEHEVRLLPNHMFTLTTTVSPANTSLVVTSSNPTVAAARMANGNIQVVGITEGTTVVTVNSTDGYAEVDSCLVKVYTLRGDVNCDGFVNINDVTTLINYLLSGNAEGIDIINADTNNDGKTNIGDVTRLINHLLSGDELDPKEEPIEGAETFTVNGVSFTMVAVEGGTFTMGATPEQGDDALDAERPAHQVTLSDYAIGQTEVTQALWLAVMGTNPSRFKDRPENPVEGVTWIDCQTFIAQLNQLTGKQFRLPTEAEWEYAARGGNQSQGYKYAGSNDIDEVAWYDENSSSTQPVGTKKANELDLYDMSGNVWEWCQDYYGDYSAEPQTNPTGPETGTDRIRRGVGWNGSQLNGRVSHRSSRAETYKYNSLGLRLAL